jgi:Flp pilus assembly protein TadB
MSIATDTRDLALRTEARARVQVRTGLKIHGAVFVVASTVMLLINILASPSVPWFWFPFLGWLTGLLIHATVVRHRLSTRGERAFERELASLTAETRRP